MQTLKPLASFLAGLFLLAVAVYILFFERFSLLTFLFLLIMGVFLTLVGWVELRAALHQRRFAIDSPRFRRFLLDQVVVLRTLQFFEKHTALSDDDLVSRLIKQLKKECGDDVGEFARDPVQLALLDPSRAAHIDSELPTPPGSGGYTEVLEDLARISRGAFAPKNIRERVTEDKGHVAVGFTIDGKEQSIRARLEDDWIDPDFIPALDPFLAETGRRFVIPDWGGQDFLVLCLTPAEQKALKEKLKWPV